MLAGITSGMRRLGLLRTLTALVGAAAGVAATASLLAPVGAHSAPAAAAPPRVGAPYLQGLAIHRANGSVLRADLPPRQADGSILLGRTPRGWAIAAGSGLFLVTSGSTTRLDTRSVDVENRVLLSTDRRHIVHGYGDQADGFALAVTDLDGERVLDTYVPNASPSAADDERVYLSGPRGVVTVDYATGRTARPVRRPAALVDPALDVVFTRRTRYGAQVGPTRLSDPGERAWTAAIDPVAISPDGRFVVGRGGAVRRMSDGALVRALPVPSAGVDTRVIGWGGPAAVLAVVDAGRGRQALVRCRVAAGPCTRVTAPTTATLTLGTSESGVNIRP